MKLYLDYGVHQIVHDNLSVDEIENQVQQRPHQLAAGHRQHNLADNSRTKYTAILYLLVQYMLCQIMSTYMCIQTGPIIKSNN